MSHFTVAVILPKHHKTDVRAALEEQLAPYDENERVEPYERPCWCVGVKARNEARDKIEFETKIAALRTDFHAGLGPITKEELARRSELMMKSAKELGLTPAQSKKEYKTLDHKINKAWEEYTEPLSKTLEDETARHSLFGKPDEKCEECKGLGVSKTTYNPKSKWDWWTIGGRWDGAWKGKNQRPVSYLLKNWNGGEFAPFAIVTPDRKWIEEGQMGWWGIVSDQKDPVDWHTQAKKVFSQYAEHEAVLIDAHI